jgi:hypothetical protein
MTDSATTNILLTHFGSATLVVGAIQWLKKAKWVQQASKLICRTASVIAAIAIHLGITWTWNPTEHTLLISGLTLSVIAVNAFHIAAQYIYQETGYQALQGIQSIQAILDWIEKNAPAKG